MSVAWLPARPSHWVDFATQWKESVPDAWPANMFRDDSEANADQTALGECMGYGRELLEWILQSIWVQRDSAIWNGETVGLWLDRWEAVWLLARRSTVALRQSAILGRMRAYGAGDNETIKAVFAEVFGGDVADVSFTAPTAAEVVAAETLGAVTYERAHNQMHIHSTNDDIDPDRSLGLDLIEYAAPTWQSWTLGRYQTLKWDTEGGWDTACWG